MPKTCAMYWHFDFFILDPFFIHFFEVSLHLHIIYIYIYTTCQVEWPQLVMEAIKGKNIYCLYF